MFGQPKPRKLKNEHTSSNKIVYAVLVSVLMIVALICGRLNQQQMAHPAADASLQIHVIDVGQGDSILLTADGHAMLIDAGEPQKGDAVLSYLEQQKISTLDYALATHLHADHIGGMPKVLDQVTVKTVIEPDCPDDLIPTTAAAEEYLRAVQSCGAEYRIVSEGEHFSLGGAEITVLAPVPGEADSLNNTSLVLLVEYEGFTALFTGDMETAEEASLLSRGYALKADFLKVGHHGSATSTGTDFLAEVQPAYAAVSCGKDNDYGHPAPQTLEALAAYTDEVYVTANDGTIVLSYDADSGEIQVQTKKK